MDSNTVTPYEDQTRLITKKSCNGSMLLQYNCNSPKLGSSEQMQVMVCMRKPPHPPAECKTWPCTRSRRGHRGQQVGDQTIDWHQKALRLRLKEWSAVRIHITEASPSQWLWIQLLACCLSCRCPPYDWLHPVCKLYCLGRCKSWALWVGSQPNQSHSTQPWSKSGRPLWCINTLSDLLNLSTCDISVTQILQNDKAKVFDTWKATQNIRQEPEQIAQYYYSEKAGNSQLNSSWPIGTIGARHE